MDDSLRLRLRAQSKLIGYREWEEEEKLLTHVFTFRYGKNDWDYGFTGTDAEATYQMLRLNAQSVRIITSD